MVVLAYTVQLKLMDHVKNASLNVRLASSRFKNVSHVVIRQEIILRIVTVKMVIMKLD